VAIGADFDVKPVALDGRASLEIVAAGAVNCDGVIIGVNTGLHEAPFVRVRSARPPRDSGRRVSRLVSYSRVARSRCKPRLYDIRVTFPNLDGIAKPWRSCSVELIAEIGYVLDSEIIRDGGVYELGASDWFGCDRRRDGSSCV